MYWKFDDYNNKVETSNPPFPRPIGPWWFGCPQYLSVSPKVNFCKIIVFCFMPTRNAKKSWKNKIFKCKINNLL